MPAYVFRLPTSLGGLPATVYTLIGGVRSGVATTGTTAADGTLALTLPVGDYLAVVNGPADTETGVREERNPGNDPDALVRVSDLQDTTTDASVALRAAFGSAARRRQVTGRSAFPAASRNVTNGSSNTQVQQSTQFVLDSDVADLSFTQGNFYRSAPTSTALAGLSSVTIRMGLWDGTTTYPIFWRNGSRDLILEPGAIASTEPLVFKGVKGQRLWLVRWLRWATAPANFPGATVVANTGTEFSEMGTALTDRTTNYSQFFTRTVGNYAILPPLAITATSQPGPVVAILGDSIASDGANDYNTDDPDNGWAQGGLGDAGIPWISLGTSSLAMSHVMASKAARAQLFAGLPAAGVTHLLLALSTNDWANGVTAATLLAQHATIKAELDPLGIKTIPVTSLPKTNGNTATAAEVNTFAQRAIFNAALRANNGVGDGYYDLSKVAENPADPNSWRQDVRAGAAVSIVTAGTGYVNGDYLRFPGGGGGGVSAVDANGGITSFYNAVGGGFLVEPPSVFSAERRVYSGATNGTLPAPGTGATFSYTGVAATVPTNDGTHPNSAVTRLIRQDFAAKAPTLIKV